MGFECCFNVVWCVLGGLGCFGVVWGVSTDRINYIVGKIYFFVIILCKLFSIFRFIFDRIL